MDRVLATEAFQRSRRLDDLLRLRLPLVRLTEVGTDLERSVDRLVPSHHRGRVHLAETVTDDGREPEHAGRVADPLLPLDRLEGDDLRDPVRAIRFRRVADDLIASPLVEVHVDVGHLDPVRVEEPLEQQAVPKRVEVRDPQRVGRDRARCRPAPRTDTDPLFACEPDQVPHDEEVAGEAHLRDDRELRVDALEDLYGRRRPVALLHTTLHELPQVRLERLAMRRLEPWQPVLGTVLDHDPLELRKQLHPFGDHQRLVARVGQLAEDAAHLLRRLEVELLGVEPEALRIRLQLLLLDAQQNVMRLRVLLPGVVQVVRRNDRHAELSRDPDLLADDPALIRQAVVLDLDEVLAGAEDVARLAGGREGAIVLAVHEQHTDLRRETSGKADQAVGVFGEQLLVHPRPVVEAFEVREGDQSEEVAVALLVLGEQREVVVLLLALPRRAIEPGAGRHVRLDPYDRFHSRLPRRLVEPERAEHGPVVRDRDRRHPVASGLAEDRGRARVGAGRLDTRSPVEQGVFRVRVQMDEPWAGHVRWWSPFLERFPHRSRSDVDNLHGCDSQGSEASTPRAGVKVAGRDGPARARRRGHPAADPRARPLCR